MNENIDLTKILEGCPNGTKLYSPFIGDVKFSSISGKYIYVSTMYGNLEVFDKQGKYGHYDGECMLLPSKDQRDWSKFERFRDKPKVERFNPHTLQPFDKVLVKDDYEIWQVEFFSHICQREPEGWCQCSGDVYYFCIPYNEETMPLVGTKEDCPEYYKWWEE